MNAIDVTHRDAPFDASTVIVGDLNAPEECQEVFIEEPTVVFVGGRRGCAFSGGVATPPVGLLLLAVGLWWWRGRRA